MVFQLYRDDQFITSVVSGLTAPASQNINPRQLATFLHILFTPWSKTNDTGHTEFCQLNIIFYIQSLDDQCGYI